MPYFIFSVLGKDVFVNVLSENLTQLVSDLRSEYRELVLPGKRLGSQSNRTDIRISSRAEAGAFT